MLPFRLEMLAEVFAQAPDPRKPRGIRQPLLPVVVQLGFAGSRFLLDSWDLARRHWHLE